MHVLSHAFKSCSTVATHVIAARLRRVGRRRFALPKPKAHWTLFVPMRHLRFGSLVVKRPAPRAGDRSRLWACLCDCGVICVYRHVDLVSGNARDCGHSKTQDGRPVVKLFGYPRHYYPDHVWASHLRMPKREFHERLFHADGNFFRAFPLEQLP